MDLLLAESKLIEAKADLQLLEAPAWRPDLLVADSVVAQVEAKVQQTKTELERLTVLAPKMPASMSQESDFKVLQVNIRPGEFVGMMQGEAFIVLGNVGKLYVRVDIDENEIDRFRPNLDGIAKPRGNPDKPYDIEFVRVEPYVIPKKSLTGGSMERVDTRVLQVIYRLKMAKQDLYVGQQMEVFLNTPK